MSDRKQGVLRWLEETFVGVAPGRTTRLAEVVRAHLGDADEDTVRLVVAVAGLLGTVAYADRDYAAVEEVRIRDVLGRIDRLGPSGVDAICAVLREDIVSIATVEAPRYAREVREHAERDVRREILDALVDVAAADDEITLAETNVLRSTTTALGLSQEEYNASQSRHRDKLRVLAGSKHGEPA